MAYEARIEVGIGLPRCNAQLGAPSANFLECWRSTSSFSLGLYFGWLQAGAVGRAVAGHDWLRAELWPAIGTIQV